MGCSCGCLRCAGYNVREMRKLVRNGPNKHPGATHVEDEEGNVVSLAALSLRQREDLAKRLGSTPRELKVRMP